MSTNKDHLHHLIDELADDLVGELLHFGEFLRQKQERRAPLDDESRAWLGAGAQEAAKGLEEIEAGVDPAHMATWLSQMEAAGKPVKWDPDKGEFVEIAG